MTEKLKSCPVCGSGEDSLSIEPDWGDEFLSVYCCECGISGLFFENRGPVGRAQRKAREAWNALPRRDEK